MSNGSNITGCLGCLGVVVFGIYFGVASLIKSCRSESSHSPKSVGLAPLQTQPAKAPPKTPYYRSLLDPLGKPWPKHGSELEGYVLFNNDGRSELTIDNTTNNYDVFVKLYSLDYENPIAVRHFYVPFKQSFTLKNIRKGTYDIRCRNLMTGELSKSDKIVFEEKDNTREVEYTTIRLTLYKVRNGNTQTYPISEEDF